MNLLTTRCCNRGDGPAAPTGKYDTINASNARHASSCIASVGCGMFDSIESSNRTCPFTDNGIRDRQIHSIKRQTADLIISPPRPRYNRFRSMVGTRSVNNSSMLLGR